MTKRPKDNTVGPWAKQKLEALGQYLNFYTTVLKKQSHWLHGTIFVDAFGLSRVRRKDKAPGPARPLRTRSSVRQGLAGPRQLTAGRIASGPTGTHFQSANCLQRVSLRTATGCPVHSSRAVTKLFSGRSTRGKLFQVEGTGCRDRNGDEEKNRCGFFHWALHFDVNRAAIRFNM